MEGGGGCEGPIIWILTRALYCPPGNAEVMHLFRWEQHNLSNMCCSVRWVDSCSYFAVCVTNWHRLKGILVLRDSRDIEHHFLLHLDKSFNSNRVWVWILTVLYVIQAIAYFIGAISLSVEIDEVKMSVHFWILINAFPFKLLKDLWDMAYKTSP